MCYGAEAAWVPAVIAALGTGAQMYETDRTAKKQDRLAAEGIIKQGQLNAKASKKVSDDVQAIKSANPQADAAKQTQTYMDAIRRAQPAASGALPGTPGASTRFAEDVGTAREAVAAEGADKAATMGRIDAPFIQRTRETQRLASTASDLGLIGQDSKMLDYLTKLRIAAKRNNPWVMAAGTAAQAYGSAAGANAGFGGGGGNAGAGVFADNVGYGVVPYAGNA